MWGSKKDIFQKGKTFAPKFVFIMVFTLIVLRINTAFSEDYSGIFVPEVTTLQEKSSYCIIRADISDGSDESRRQKIVDFLASSFEKTYEWRAQYIPAAIDYVKFSYLYVVSFESCSSSQKLITILHEALDVCENAADIPCPEVDIHVSGQGASPLVRDMPKPTARTIQPIQLFETYRDKGDLQKCVLEIPIVNAESMSDITRIFNDLLKIKREFRFSIMDERLINKSIFFLFSRQCSNMNILFASIKYIIPMIDKDADKYLGVPNFHPDIAEYRFSETGERETR